MTTQDWLAIFSLSLNGVWFLYAMLNSRFLRNHIRHVETNLFACEPATHAWKLEEHFRKKRNAQGIMLMASVTAQLQTPTLKRKSPPHDTPRTNPLPPQPS